MDKEKSTLEHPNAALLLRATKGFDHLFSDDVTSARNHFETNEDPFHLLGLGVCAFLEAVLGMESGLITEASRCLSLAEAGTRQQMKASKPPNSSYRSRFQYGLEWEVLNADAVVLLGLTHALGESYMGSLQCMYALNSAHSKFTKLYKTVFPDNLHTTSPVSANSPTRNAHPSQALYTPFPSKSSPASTTPVTVSHSTPPSPAPVSNNGFFSRWLGVASVSTPTLPLQVAPDGPVEDLIVSGTAFGFGMFNLVLSLLPKKVQGVVGFFGLQHDRPRALRALALSATKLDVHGIFASLVIMTYRSMVLLLSGYQADEQGLLSEFEEIVSRVERKYPSGSLWILNKAKIRRMSRDAEGAIRILKDSLHSYRPRHFTQANIMIYFEMAWTLLSQRMYTEAAEAFMKLTELNSWSHATYYFLVAGCLLAVGDIEKAQILFDKIPAAIERKKIADKELPIEVYIKKKLVFYKDKQNRRGGDSRNWIEVIKINPAEETGIFWNMHARVEPSIAQLRIESLSALTPPVSIIDITVNSPPNLSENLPPPANTPDTASLISSSPALSSNCSPVDLDTPDELSVRALLLGINYRTKAAYESARRFLNEAHNYDVEVNSWVSGVAMFELAVLDLKETEARTKEVDMDPEERKEIWTDTLKRASGKLDVASGLSRSTIDLSTRLESRITMLKDEIASKKDLEGISVY